MAILNKNGRKRVFSGFAAGSAFNKTGGAADYICLTENTTWNKTDNPATSYSLLYGVEYEIGHAGSYFFGQDMVNHDVPCAGQSVPPQ